MQRFGGNGNVLDLIGVLVTWVNTLAKTPQIVFLWYIIHFAICKFYLKNENTVLRYQ